MQRTMVFMSAALFLAAEIHAAEGVPAELQEAIRLRAQAVAKKEAAVWDRLTTADFTTLLEDGRLQTKAERLAQLKGEQPEALPPAPLTERFSTHGNTVIQRTQGQDRSWIITVWVKDGHEWRVAAVQITPAPKSPGPEEVVAKAAEAQLRIVDAGRYEEFYDGTTKRFQQSNMRGLWAPYFEANRAGLGALVGRKVESVAFHSATIVFGSSFAHGHEVEKVTVVEVAPGNWKVDGYNYEKTRARR